MSTISVIVNTYERMEALSYCLVALSEQTRLPNEVIVVDDGGFDQSLNEVSWAVSKDDLPASYVWHPHKGMGFARCRNEGGRLSTGDMMVFIDSDIMLAQDALRAYEALYKINPHRAIGGYYQYLPGMEITAGAIRDRFDDIWSHQLPPKDVPQTLVPIGNDVREFFYQTGRMGVDVFKDDGLTVYKSPFSLLGGNMMIPRHIWNQIEGWDEKFTQYGGEDGELSLQIAQAGYGFSYSRTAAGAHIAHPKHPEATGEGEQRVLEYIKKKWPQWFPDGTPLWTLPDWQHPGEGWRSECFQ